MGNTIKSEDNSSITSNFNFGIKDTFTNLIGYFNNRKLTIPSSSKQKSNYFNKISSSYRNLIANFNQAKASYSSTKFEKTSALLDASKKRNLDID